MITTLLDRLDESGWLIDILNEEEDAEGNAEKFKMNFNNAVNDLKVREEELKDLVRKIGALNAKNVNRKIKRIYQKYHKLEEEKEEVLVDLATELLERDEELAEKNQEIDELVENLDKAIHKELCHKK
eukprot:gene7372-13112_t